MYFFCVSAPYFIYSSKGHWAEAQRRECQIEPRIAHIKPARAVALGSRTLDYINIAQLRAELLSGDQMSSVGPLSAFVFAERHPCAPRSCVSIAGRHTRNYNHLGTTGTDKCMRLELIFFSPRRTHPT